nr:7522_t:CDS:2 [Entrophospora candida]
MKLTIATYSEKSQKFPTIIEISGNATVGQLKTIIYEKYNIYYPERQHLTFSKQPLSEEKTLKEYGIKEDDTIFFKDLGPQMCWRSVFVIEYLGPLIIHPIFYNFDSIIYGQNFKHSEMQTGFNLAYWVYGPWNADGTKTAERDDKLFSQISNFATHITLRDICPPGTRNRYYYGYGFDFVTCPNYFFEVLAWTSISILTNSFAAYLFTFIGFIQMYFWAIKKHKSCHIEFRNYPKNRKAMIPFIL